MEARRNGRPYAISIISPSPCLPFVDHQHSSSNGLCVLRDSFHCEYLRLHIHIMSRQFTLAQSHNDRKTKIWREKQIIKDWFCFVCFVVSVFYVGTQVHHIVQNTTLRLGFKHTFQHSSISVCTGSCNKRSVLWWSLRYYMHTFLLH